MAQHLDIETQPQGLEMELKTLEQKEYFFVFESLVLILLFVRRETNEKDDEDS